tara:strand:- start:9441 stop:10253 length:813 start_codon:yes stop_codon:yes gene_type:complete
MGYISTLGEGSFLSSLVTGGRGGGGGAPTLDNPPSFSDSLALYRSDEGQTLVDGLLDVWADQSGNGHDASAAATSDRQILLSNDGAFGFKDVFLRGSDHFRTLTIPNTPMQQYSYDICIMTYHLNNPALYAPMWGNVNSSIYPLFVGLGNNLAFTIKPNTGSNWSITYNVAQLGDYLGLPLKLTVLVDLTQAVASNKFKLYRDGVLISISSTSGTTPGVTDTTNNNQFNIISTSTARNSAFFSGYVAIWDRLLTATEIAANNDWKDEIWN